LALIIIARYVNHVGAVSRYNYYDYNNAADLSLINSLSLKAEFYDYLDPFGIIVGVFNGIYYKNHRIK
jgi:hypothetical protein